MPETTGSNTETVYVRLLDEGTSVSRPTQAVVLGDGRYKLLATPNYDPSNEIWEFLPGSVVRCARENGSEGIDILVAQEILADE